MQRVDLPSEHPNASQLHVLCSLMQRELNLNRVGPHFYEHLLMALVRERVGADPAPLEGQPKDYLTETRTVELMLNSFMVLARGNSRADLLVTDAIRMMETRDRAPQAQLAPVLQHRLAVILRPDNPALYAKLITLLYTGPMDKKATEIEAVDLRRLAYLGDY